MGFTAFFIKQKLVNEKLAYAVQNGDIDAVKSAIAAG